MNKFLMSSSLYQQPVIFDIHNAGSQRWGFAILREAIFIRLLTLCAEGQIFSNSSHLATVTSLPEVQCNLVWDVCINDGVLNKADCGYSALKWLRNQGFLNDAEKRPKTAPNRAEKDEAYNSLPAPEIARIDGVLTQESRHRGRPRKATQTAPQNRVAVRPNLWLSADEIAELKQKYSDSEITWMADFYSEWKRKKGVEISISDFKALSGWVGDAMRQKRQQQQQPQTEQFPDWVHGGTNEQQRGGNHD